MIARVVVFVLAFSEGIAPVGSAIRVRGVEGTTTRVEFGGVKGFSCDIMLFVLVCPEEGLWSLSILGLESSG